jgi:hypothetical protein
MGQRYQYTKGPLRDEKTRYALALVLGTTEPVPSCTLLFISQKGEVVFALQNLLQKTLLNQQEQEHFSNISGMETILFFQANFSFFRESCFQNPKTKCARTQCKMDVYQVRILIMQRPN